MTLTVKLDPELKKQFENACRRQRATKSSVVTDLVRAFVARGQARSSYEVAERLRIIGSDDSGPRDVAANAKKSVRQAVRAKHHR